MSSAQAAIPLVRLFYTLLYTATVALWLTWWVQRDGNESIADLIGLRQAKAQTAIGSPSGAPGSGQGLGAIMAAPPVTTPVSRPDGWVGGAPPTGAAQNAVGAFNNLANNGAPSGPEERFEGTQRIAQVGNEFILLADILGQVNETLAQNADRIPPSQIEQARQMIIRQRMSQLIETKLVVAELRRKIPADKLKQIEGKIGEQFTDVELNRAMERGKFKSRLELEDDLRKSGSSVDREKRAFVERMLAMSWVQQNVKVDDEVTHEQMLEYYQQHRVDYEYQGRVKWQQIQIRFDRASGKPAAYAVLAEAGNKIVAGGEFGSVAQAVSQGFTADKGGVHDWTTQGSLASDVLNQALFALPVGQLSPILEDDKSFHIIKVVERQEAGRRPFTEVQTDIKQKIKQERNAAASKKYLEQLKRSTQVWTVFDSSQPPAADSPTAIYSALQNGGSYR